MISKFSPLILILLLIISCKNTEINYVDYYNQVNKIDSINRIAIKPVIAIKEYKKLFRKYEPKNQDRIEEFETYLMLSDQYHKKFGGKKNLNKLITLVAPNWKYKKHDKNFINLYQKHGIDSLAIEEKVSDWKKNLNKRLVDSFTVAFTRDQEGRRENLDIIKINDKKNLELLFWTFENFGYPSLQKIGLYGNNEVFMPMSVMYLHMVDENEFEQLKEILFQYVKSGDFPPRDYGEMVDRNLFQIKKEKSRYKLYLSNETVIDTAKIDRNRKEIGYPSLYHSKIIYNDFMQKLNSKN